MKKWAPALVLAMVGILIFAYSAWAITSYETSIGRECGNEDLQAPVDHIFFGTPLNTTAVINLAGLTLEEIPNGEGGVSRP